MKLIGFVALAELMGNMILAIGLTACSPKIYVIDRQTVLEQEAAGQWPEYDKDVIKKISHSSPIPFEQTQMSASRTRLYNVINGELADDSVVQNGPAAGSSKEGLKK